MKIRTKISLWIIGAGVFTGLVLSGVVFYELIEQYYEVIDEDLASISTDVGDLSLTYRDVDTFTEAADRFPGIQRYWITIYSAGEQPIWQTSVAGKIDIPFDDKATPYTFQTELLPSKYFPDMNDDDKLVFRVESTPIEVGGKPYILKIGKPSEDPTTEFRESAGIIITGLVVAVLALVMLSNFIAGRILKPISEINLVTKNINDKTLDQRIPLGSFGNEFNRLSGTLNEMLDRLQLAFNKQKRLLSDASHELRSPLALLELETEERLQNKDLPEEYENQLIRQQETLHRMSRMINSLLDLSALEIERRLEIVDILLSDLVTSVLDDFSELLNAVKVKVRTMIPRSLELRGDIDKIRRVIVNLVENAVKYNREDGQLMIEAKVETPNIILSVFNTGPGIPKEDLPRVFDQFYRVEASRSPLYGGTGLGLTIVKSIVELHGGSVGAHSRFGEWTRIDVSLPLNTE
jgi:two-component system, OmpR family, sensor kinase